MSPTTSSRVAVSDCRVYCAMEQPTGRRMSFVRPFWKHLLPKKATGRSVPLRPT